MLNRKGAIYAIGAVGLGIVGFVHGEFARNWQPVPQGVPARELLAYVSAAYLVLAGLLVLHGRSAAVGALALAACYGLWTLALHGPVAAARPLDIAAWLGFAELLSLTLSGLMLAMLLDSKRRPRLERIMRVAFGLCPLVYGASHFAHLEFTANMIPDWMPWRMLWAKFTGFAHVAAGLAIASGVLARPAASLLALMMGLFVLLVHVPRVLGDPASHHEWTMIFVALSLTGGAWIVALLLGAASARCARPGHCCRGA